MSRSAEEELLRANQAFYESFDRRDIEAMDELWAHHTPVACVHPGWPPIHGRDEVMESWREILLGEESPRVRFERPHAVLLGAAGFVTCLEHLEGGTVVATNLFSLEEGVWQLIHHHAGPLGVDEDEAAGSPLN